MMRTAIGTVGSIVFGSQIAAVSGLLALAASPIPSIDIAKLCTDATDAVDAGRAEASCRRQETEARAKLQILWPRLSAAERSVCLACVMPWLTHASSKKYPVHRL